MPGPQSWQRDDQNEARAAARAGRAGWLAGLIVFAVYLGTLPHRVASADNAEFQALAGTGGIAHAGYPTFVLALRAFGHLPWSTVAFRANLLVAVCGALAAGLAAYEGARLSGRGWAGMAAGVAFALGGTMWQSSTVAEVYVFTLVLGVGLYLLARRLAARPTGADAAAAGLLGGLGVGSHLTVLALAPVVGLALVHGARAGRLRARHGAALALGFAFGLAPFAAFVAWDRPDQPMNYLAARTLPGPARAAMAARPVAARLGDAVYLLSGRQYLPVRAGVHRPRASLERAEYALADLALNEWFGLGLPLAFLGLGALARRRGPAAALLVTWLVAAAFLVWYGAIERDLLGPFFVGGLWAIALLAAVGLGELARRVPWLGAVAALALVGGPLVRLALPGPPAGAPAPLRWTWQRMPAGWSPLRADGRWDAYGRGALAAAPPRAIVLCNWTEGMTLAYLHHAAGLRPDVDLVLTENARELASNARAALATGRPCATTLREAPRSDLPGLALAPLGAWPAGRAWRIAAAAP